jgi:hypothetical protein
MALETSRNLADAGRPGGPGVGAEERRRPTWRSRLPAPLPDVIVVRVSRRGGSPYAAQHGAAARFRRRLTATTGYEAGFAVLADSGPNALRIEPLCERLHVTKGSFYWHFTDMATYRGALVEAWGRLARPQPPRVREHARQRTTGTPDRHDADSGRSAALGARALRCGCGR